MKKVLIITYYWPPSGGAGVMRWLKMSKYLPEFGWQPIIFTPLDPDSGNTDFSLIKDVRKDIEVIKKPIWEPYNLYKWLTGKPKKSKFGAGYITDMSKSSFFDRLSVFLRGNFMIPDPRLFWVRPSIRFLKRYLTVNKIDLIVSTGPPHSMHLIGLGLRKKLNIPWLADFRDPWTQIAFFHKLNLTKWAEKKHRKLEENVLKYADIVTTVSPGWAEDIGFLCPNKKVYTIYNGFDPDDYIFKDITLDKEFSFTHLGSLTSDRNPVALWKALGEIKKENATFAKKIKIKLIGYTEKSVINSIENYDLYENLEVIPSVNHNKGLSLLKKSHLLILPINISPFSRGILPGKMYEYFAVQRPILAIGPKDGDFVKIIHETKAGDVFEPNEKDKIKNAVLSYFDQYLTNKINIDTKDIFRFSRKNIASQLIQLIESKI